MTKGRVLLADDEPQVRAFVKVFLTAARFQVVEANDVVDALEAMESAGGGFDLLITDIRMPRMDGIALARCAAGRYPHIPVLFISGYVGGPDSLECETIARWAFLEKPFTPKLLLQRINKLLGAQSAGLSATAP